MVMEKSLEGKTTWMSVLLIGYSKGWLCDCQHLTERDNGEKSEYALVFHSPVWVSPSYAAFRRFLPNSLCHVDLYES